MKEAICFLPKLTSMSETTSTKILLFLSTGVFIISFGLLQEPSSLFFVDFIVVVEEIYTSVAWDFGDKFWTYNLCFLQLADCCFSCTMIRKLFSTFFKANTSYGYFHYVSYGIFAHWFSLDQMFKFSVSFATEVEKNRPSHGCFNRGLRSTKDSKRATNNVHDLKSLLLSLNNPCSFKCLKSVAVMVCVWLQPFLFFIFLL